MSQRDLIPVEIPPLPNQDQRAAEALKRFDAGDYEGVLGSSESLRSAAGLPLRSLAALQLLRRETDPNRLAELAAILADSMDFMTPMFLAEAEQRFKKLQLLMPNSLKDWRSRWDQKLTTAFLQKKIDPSRPITWHTHEGADYVIEVGQGGKWRFSSEDELRTRVKKILASLAMGLPEGLGIHVLASGRNITGFHEDSVGEVEANGWMAKIVVADRDAFERGEKRSRQLITTVLCLAGISALFGIIQSGRAYLRAVELARRQSEFVAAVSHEMRTPLAAIGLLAENLESGAAQRAGQQKDHIHLIREQSRRLGTLIDNVLVFTRGQMVDAFRPIDVCAMADAAAALMRPLAESKAIEFQVEVTPITELPNGDAAALGRALINLIDNAIKHTPPNGSVACKIGPKNANEWMMEVSDSGPGIPESERTKIFEAFYRIGEELRRTTAGTGLGLALVKLTVDAHHGRIDVSDAPGGGSRFTLTLPFQP